MLKILTIAVKVVIGFGLTAVIGYIVKAEHKIDDVIDAYFESRKK